MKLKVLQKLELLFFYIYIICPIKDLPLHKQNAQPVFVDQILK